MPIAVWHRQQVKQAACHLAESAVMTEPVMGLLHFLQRGRNLSSWHGPQYICSSLA